MSAIGTIQRAHLTAPAELRQQAQEFETPSNFRAIWQLLNSMVLFIALWVLMYCLVDVSRWLVALAACLAGVVLIRIFIIFHDCGHGVFFTSVRPGQVCKYVRVNLFLLLFSSITESLLVNHLKITMIIALISLLLKITSSVSKLLLKVITNFHY